MNLCLHMVKSQQDLFIDFSGEKILKKNYNEEQT